MTNTVTVKDSTDTELVAGVDYELAKSGIKLFISDDFASLSLQIDVLSDPSISGNGLSPFMQIDLAT